MRKLSSRGMTLVEILIVLTILGGLMAYLAKNLFSQRDKANISNTKIAIGGVVTAVQQYYNDCGNLPEALDSLVAADENCKNWGPEPYIKKNQMKDGWNRPFLFSVEGGNFIVRSLGKDGKEGGDGFNADISSDQE